MPTYVFESRSGLQVERDFSVVECPGFVMVSRVRYRKIVANTNFMFGSFMKHMDKPNSEREATAEYRDWNEWKCAASGSDDWQTHDVTETNQKVTDQLSIPRKDEVAKKREALKAGVKPPKGIKLGNING